MEQIDPPLELEPARSNDAEAIAAIVHEAYKHYVARMNAVPAPMKTDYRARIATGGVHVLRVQGVVVGSVIIERDDDALRFNNLVVDRSQQGNGHGRRIIAWIEEKARQWQLSVVELFTNELMHENISLYTHLGYEEIDRSTADGYHRVFFRKRIT